MRPIRRTSIRCAAAAVLAAAPLAPAAAQDRDPFQAALDAQAVRERQAKQMDRAENRTLQPIPWSEPAPTLPSGGSAPPARGVKLEMPPHRDPGEGAYPWVLPLVAVVAGGVGFAVRRARRRRWSELPGHHGLRRD